MFDKVQLHWSWLNELSKAFMTESCLLIYQILWSTFFFFFFKAKLCSSPDEFGVKWMFFITQPKPQAKQSGPNNSRMLGPAGEPINAIFYCPCGLFLLQALHTTTIKLNTGVNNPTLIVVAALKFLVWDKTMEFMNSCAHIEIKCVCGDSPSHWLSWMKKPRGQLGTQRPSCRLDWEGQDVQLSANGPVQSQQEWWHSEKDTGDSSHHTKPYSHRCRQRTLPCCVSSLLTYNRIKKTEMNEWSLHFG